MKKNGSVLNKYTLSLVIVLLVLSIDILLHKGMARVILPATFIQHQTTLALKPQARPLSITKKIWVKAVNSIERITQLPANTAGFEMDVYFDTAKNHLQVYHDSAAYSELDIESILKIYSNRNLSCSIWLDFKNLSSLNQVYSLQYISRLREKYKLQHKLIIESAYPELLSAFCDSGFFTSYYVPVFNPYLLSEKENMEMLDTIAGNLKNHPTSALSGYYFQYPFLTKYFPNFPVFTWAERGGISLVSLVFNRKLENDRRLAVILYP